MKYHSAIALAVCACLLAGCASAPSNTELAQGTLRLEANISHGHYDGVRTITNLENGTSMVDLQVLAVYADSKWASGANLIISSKDDEDSKFVIWFQSNYGDTQLEAIAETYLKGDLISRNALGNLTDLRVGHPIKVKLQRIDAHHLRYSINGSVYMLTGETPFTMDRLGTTTVGANTVVTFQE